MARRSSPAPAPRRVVLIAFDGLQSLDLAGPAEVFAAIDGAYDVVTASSAGRPVGTAPGYRITTRRLATVRPSPRDTVLVVGGREAAVRAAVADRALGRWLTGAARVAARLGSVCSGTFVLAAHGLLDGHRAATHWSACERLAAFRPAVAVDREAIFVVDGRLWTSAGVTTGIDMALAMVEADHGRAAADEIAARLVLYTRRPGFQSQWSTALVGHERTGDGLGRAIGWARGHLAELDVPTLARHAGLSVRSLHRRCHEQLRVTPAKLIEQLRVEHARSLLSAGLAAKAIAHRCGFGEPARMTRAFRRALGVRPRDYRLLFAEREAAPPAAR